MLFLIWTLLAFVNEGECGHKCHGHDKEAWSYDNQKEWPAHYPSCGKTRQTPINIVTSDVEEKKELEDVTFIGYDKPVSGNLTNNGHTVQLTVTDGVERSVQGSLLPKNCKLIQMHFHWGSRPTRGSEHRINGRRYAMEMHLVHRCDDNQLLVLAVLFEESTNDPGLGPFVKRLKYVKHKGQQTFVDSYDLRPILPKNLRYFFHYLGSLTTPECDEIVTWLVLGELRPIGNPQIQEFRSLFSTKESDEHQCKMNDNYRGLQPLNGRTISSLREDFKR